MQHTKNMPTPKLLASMSTSLVRILIICALSCLASLPALARERISGFCEVGGRTVVAPQTAGQSPVTRSFQQSFPGCTVNVYVTGSGGSRAAIYSDNAGTALANPFTANLTTGYYFFYADNGSYDIQISGGGLASPVTFGDNYISDSRRFYVDATASPFNAQCDGMTDDSTAISAAISSFGGNGGVVYLPRGICVVASSVSLPQNVILSGSGTNPGTTIYSSSLTGAGIVIASGTNSYHYGGLENISIQGPGNTNTSSVGLYIGGDPASVYSPSSYQGNNFFIRNVYVSQFGKGVQLGNNAYRLTFYNSQIYQNGYGFYVGSGLSNMGGDLTFYSTEFFGNTQGAFLSVNGNANFTLFNGVLADDGVPEFSGNALTLFCYGCHWEHTNGYFITANSGAYVKVYINGGNVSFGGTTNNGSLFNFDAGTAILNLTVSGLEIYGSGMTQIFEIQPSVLASSTVDISGTNGNEGAPAVPLVNSDAPPQILHIVSNTSGFPGALTCLLCVSPNISGGNGSALTLGSGSSGGPPAALHINPTTSTSTKRAAMDIDTWQLRQDISSSGTKDYGLVNITTGIGAITHSTTGQFGIGPGTYYNSTGLIPTATGTVSNQTPTSGYLTVDLLGGAAQATSGSISCSGTLSPIFRFSGPNASGPVEFFVGNGTPASANACGCPGSLFLSTNGTFYVKGGSCGTTSGWVAK
jgi:hypothetical protein